MTSFLSHDPSDDLTEIWCQIIHEWSDTDHRQTAIDLTYSHPIPNEIRSNAWFIISGARDLMHKNRNIYQHLIEISSKHASIIQIDKDLPRTFRSHQLNKIYNPKLRRILIAYTNFNHSISYTQGMNYIAGFILKQYFQNIPSVNITDNDHEDTPESKRENDIINEYWIECVEEQSFWTFVAIMNQISGLFESNLSGFHKSVECFTNLFSYHGPEDLVKHLNQENVYMTIMTSWYHTLFTHPAMNENMAKRIWDIFILENMDFSIIFKVSYLILIRHKAELMKMDFIEIVQFCKSSKCFVFEQKDDDHLIQRAKKLQLNELYLRPIRNLKHGHIEEEQYVPQQQVDVDDVDDANKGQNPMETLWSYFKGFNFVSSVNL